MSGEATNTVLLTHEQYVIVGILYVHTNILCVSLVTCV